MAVYRERRWPRITARYAALFMITAAVTAVIYDWVAAENRPHIIRFAVGFVVGVMLVHLRSYFRGDPGGALPFEFENALRPEAVAPKLHAGFTKLREAVANGLASRSYFEEALWPRLSALDRARGISGELAMSAMRGWLGRGPSRRMIAAVIDRIECQESKPR